MANREISHILDPARATCRGTSGWGPVRRSGDSWAATTERPGETITFVAVAFWNMVGAGLFGFMINPMEGHGP
jgi:hypothetical protein